jgi:hypothetical protein
MAYDDFAWGEPAPTEKQYEFAVHLGVGIRDGLTKWELSDLITEAVAIRDGAPITIVGYQAARKPKAGCGGCAGRGLAVVAAVLAGFVALAVAAGGDKSAGWGCTTAFIVLALVCLRIATRKNKSSGK